MDACVAMLSGVPGLLMMALIAAGALWLAGCARAGDKAPATGESSTAATTNTIRDLSRSEVRQRLQKLRETPVPKELKMGAMCYEMMAPPDRAEYICPKCGEKTLYPKGAAEKVEWDLRATRRHLAEVQKLAGTAIAVDESQFCRKCSPDVKEPKLVLRIDYHDGRTHAVAGIDATDMLLLNEFFSGQSAHDNGQAGETPLKTHEKRLGELLGSN